MKKIIFFALLALTFASCKSNVVFEQRNDLKLNWAQDNVQKFETGELASGTHYDSKIVIRYASNYPFNLLTLAAKIEMPDGSIQTKSIDLEMKDKDGKNIGDGLGDIWDIETPLLEDFVMTQTGKVKIELAHTMESHPKVPLLMKIGVVISNKQ